MESLPGICDGTLSNVNFKTPKWYIKSARKFNEKLKACNKLHIDMISISFLLQA